MNDTLETLLDDYNANTLWEMAQIVKLFPIGAKKPGKTAVIAALQEKYFTGERVTAAYNQCNRNERAVINRLLLRGGQASSDSFRRELVRAGLATLPPDKATNISYNSLPYSSDSYIGSAQKQSSTIFADVMARLTQRGLLFSRLSDGPQSGAPPKLQLHPADRLVIPPEVSRHLPPAEPIATTEKQWQPARTVAHDPARQLRDLYLYWDFVRRNEVQILQSGRVGKRSLKLLNQNLLTADPAFEKASDESDMPRLYALRHLLEGLKLVRSEGSKLVPTHPQKRQTPDFWLQTTPLQLLACLQNWLQQNTADELEPLYRNFAPTANTARRLLLTGLLAVPTERWWEVDEWHEELATKNENFLFSGRSEVAQRRSYGYFYFGGQYFNSVKQITEAMDKGEKQFIRATLGGFLADFGLVELGYASAEAKEWQAARLTQLGREILTTSGVLTPGVRAKTATQALREVAATYTATSEPAVAPLMADEGRVIVQPNFQILAIGPVRLATLAKLDLFAERRKADVGVFEYHLARAGVYQAQQTGMEVHEITDFLRTVSRADLPQNVRRSLEEWGVHLQRIIFRTNANLLQTADAALLNGLLENPAIRGHLARTLAPTVALINPKAETKLAVALLQQNLLPAVSGDQPAAADHSVLIQANGAIQPIHAVPSLHLRGRLTRLAEEQANGRWQITPASVRRAGGNRQKVLTLLEELAKLHRGVLPPALTAQIKQWGAYFGEAGLETLTLLEFRDPEALRDLIKTPELSTLLTPFRAGDRALAIIPSERLAEVEQLLTAFGVPVRSSVAR